MLNNGMPPRVAGNRLSSYILWSRLDAIAGDAELQEKSQADLNRLCDMLRTQCEQSMKEYEEKLKEEPSAESKSLQWFSEQFNLSLNG